MYTVTDMRIFSSTILGLHRQVALAGVGKDCHNALGIAEAFGDFQRADDVRAGRDADEQALFAAEAARHLDRLFVANGENFVVDLLVEHAGSEARAYALDRRDPSASA